MIKRDNAVLGLWTASFALRRPSLKAFIQVYIVPLGIPNSLAALYNPYVVIYFGWSPKEIGSIPIPTTNN